MNTSEAKQILNGYGSTHEHKIGKYYADFNIKVHLVRLPDSLTAKEREYAEADFDPYETIRDNLITSIANLPLNSDVTVTGRSGGWITVEYPYPYTLGDTIKIAKEIKKISELVRDAIAFVRSEEFWLNFVEGVDPKPSENYNPKTKRVIDCVMYTDRTFGVVLTVGRENADRRYYYHRDGKVSRLLKVLNGDGYTRQVRLGKSPNEMFTYFEKK